MEIRLIKPEEIDECTKIIFDSNIGKPYYHMFEILKEGLMDGIRKDEVYVSETDHEIAGVIWFQQKGMFDSFPYLKMIVVKEEARKKGIASQLMDFFENKALCVDGKTRFFTKVFLLVEKENNDSYQMYKGRGYRFIAEIPDLLMKGKTEQLLMKLVKAEKFPK